MSRDPKNIQKQIDKANQDFRRKYSFNCDVPEVNEPLECVLLLGRLNEAISLLLSLQDSYYTEYIWNASSLHNEQLKAAGLDSDFFSEVEDKLRTLRSILMGDSLDFDELYRRLYDEALGYEVYWREFYENRNKELERKLNRIEAEKKT